jgi:hypothetical protein
MFNLRFTVTIIALAAIVACCGGGSGTPPGGVYSTTDLQGVWQGNSLASGPGAPWWERAQVTIAADGSFNGTTTESSGGSNAVNGVFGISTGGVVTLAGADIFSGVMDAGKTVVVCTATWSGDTDPGTTEMKVFLKMADTYSLSDMAGTWGMVDLGSGPGAPWWGRGQVTSAADGTFNGTIMYSSGSSDPTSGVFNISTAGVVTMPLGGAADPSFSGAMDADKTVLVATNTWAGDTYPGTTVMGVGVKMAGTYSISDMVGTWAINTLASGPGEPFWQRAQVTVAADGSFSGTATSSGGGGGTISGVFSISTDGIVTVAGPSGFVGFVDAGKTVMVWVNTWGGDTYPGTTEMNVAIKIN